MLAPHFHPAQQDREAHPVVQLNVDAMTVVVEPTALHVDDALSDRELVGKLALERRHVLAVLDGMLDATKPRRGLLTRRVEQFKLGRGGACFQFRDVLVKRCDRHCYSSSSHSSLIAALS